MKFDYAIGNPPYNEDFANSGDNGNFAAPVYNDFLDATYKVANKVEMIHPARFLFNAGSTPKEWNKKMLSDKHLKIKLYEPKSSKIFSNTDIKGGIAISYHDNQKDFGAIEVFSPYEELNNIRIKAYVDEKDSIMNIIYTQNRYNMPNLIKDYPDYKSFISSEGKDRRFRNNVFQKVPLFTEEKKNEDDILVQGVLKNKRTTRYIAKKYVDFNHENLETWKVLVPRANGSGALGEVLSTPLIGYPLIGYTQTYIGIGSFLTEYEANSCLKYIKSKFCRVMLGILKITQHNEKNTWRFVPMQDFTETSDIDWTQSISDVDKQLYKKYGLSEEEINFIETHVKEME